MTGEKKIEIDEAVAKFCFRTGIPFAVTDSESFRDHFEKLHEHFKNDHVNLPLVKARWTFLKKDVHSLAYILKPKHAANGFFINNEKMNIMTSVKKYVLKRQPGEIQRAIDTQKEMTRYVAEVSRLVGDEKEMTDNMSARDYSDIFGKTKYPLLFDCAKSLNAMVCSSAASERAWSIFGFVHTPLRNRLADDKVDKIAFLYINSAILDEKDKTDYIVEDMMLRGEDFLPLE